MAESTGASRGTETGPGIGIAPGVGIGLAIDNLPIGIALGSVTSLNGFRFIEDLAE